MNNKGFTLIELLVVVLIIGILSAVALPQYEKAVEKSRAAQAFTLAKSIHQAQEAYKLANGEYTRLFGDLSIEVPGSAEGTNVCGLNAPEIRYTKDFAVALGTTGQYTGDVVVARNGGGQACYGIGYIDGQMYCSEYPGKHATNFCVKALGGKYSMNTPNWKHYTIP